MRPQSRQRAARGAVALILGLAALCIAVSHKAAFAAAAQTRSLVNAGGQLMSSGTTQVNGTLGVVLTGSASSGTTQLWSGFWTPLPSAQSAAGDPTPAAPDFVLDFARPNPAARMTTLQFGVPQGGLCTLQLFDCQGRVVRRLLHGSVPAGTTRVTWDLRADTGLPVPDGVYYYRLDFAKYSGVGKVHVLR